jgi:peptide deformylase
MIYKLVPQDDPILSSKTKHFDFDDPPMDATELFENLKETMIKNKGLGLAAPQCGLPYNAFVMGDPNNPDTIFSVFNPTIVNEEGTSDMEEGCLSFSGLYIKVKRPAVIRVRFSGHDGYVDTTDFSGYTARVFQHEYDHLQGVTFMNRASKLRLNRARKQKQKLDKIRKKNVE